MRATKTIACDVGQVAAMTVAFPVILTGAIVVNTGKTAGVLVGDLAHTAGNLMENALIGIPVNSLEDSWRWTKTIFGRSDEPESVPPGVLNEPASA